MDHEVKVLGSSDFRSAFEEYVKIKADNSGCIVLLKDLSHDDFKKELFFPLRFSDESDIWDVKDFAYNVYDLYSGVQLQREVFTYNRRKLKRMACTSQDAISAIQNNYASSLDSLFRIYFLGEKEDSKPSVYDMRSENTSFKSAVLDLAGCFTSFFISEKEFDSSPAGVIVEDIIKSDDGFVYAVRKALDVEFEGFHIKEVSSDADFIKYFDFIRGRVEIGYLEPEIFFDMNSTFYSLSQGGNIKAAIRLVRRNHSRLPIEYSNGLNFIVEPKSVEITHLTIDNSNSNNSLMNIIASLSCGDAFQRRCESIYMCVIGRHSGLYTHIGFSKKDCLVSFDGFDNNYCILEYPLADRIIDNKRAVSYFNTYSGILEEQMSGTRTD